MHRPAGGRSSRLLALWPLQRNAFSPTDVLPPTRRAKHTMLVLGVGSAQDLSESARSQRYARGRVCIHADWLSVGSIDLELALVMLGAMFSPTTLTWSVLALVLGERPLRTGRWFLLGAVVATMVIGVVAALVLGNAAATPKHPSSPKTWVAIVDLVAGALILVFLVRFARRPANPAQQQKMVDQMGKIASSPALAIIAAGATLANPGVFIPLALKDISEVNPSTVQYTVLWTVFTVASVLPLIVAVALLTIWPASTERTLRKARGWLQRHLRVIAGVILLLLAASLLLHGISGLTH